MSLLHLFVLAVVQGITEFLPVSSSGHLILLPMAMNLPDQGLAVDVAVHVGTLAAVMIFFRREIARLWSGGRDLARGRAGTADARLLVLMGIATVPVVVAGLIVQFTGLAEAMRSLAVIGWTMLIFGLLLYWADQRGGTERKFEDWSLRDAVIMGLSQALALIPGTSRSGITITASRLLGFDRRDGARVSMLMSVPTIIASGLLLGVEAVGEANWATLRDGAIGAILAFAAAYAALAVMMRLLQSVSFTPYVVYRVVLGLILLGIAYF